MIALLSGGTVRTLVIMTLSGGALALLLFALKPLLRNCLSKAAQYYLWVVVLAALLAPASRFIVLPQPSSSPLVAPFHAAVERTVVTAQERAAEMALSTQKEPPEVLLSTMASVITAFIAIYPWGVLAMLLHIVLSYALFTAKLRRARFRAGKDELYAFVGLCGDANPPRLYRSPLAVTPMLIGVFKPEVMLPDREYTDDQLKGVLLHELTHLRRRDVLVKWLSAFACALHWFNPAVWLVSREIDRACELSCDEAVIRSLDASGKQSYGDTLISVTADTHAPRTVLSTTMCEQKRELKTRLRAIMKHKKRTRLTLVLSALLILAALGVACMLGARVELSPQPFTGWDDFSKSNHMWTNWGGSWVVDNGRLVTSGGHSFALANETVYRDFTYTLTVRLNGHDGFEWGDAGPMWRTQTGPEVCGYYLGLYLDGRVILFSLGHPTLDDYELCAYEYGIKPDVDYAVKVVTSGQNIKVYIDDKLLFNVNDKNASAFAEGVIGVRSWYCLAEVDNVRVTSAR